MLLEALTYRYVGHSMGDPERYRSKAEIDEWRARDPILRLAELDDREGHMARTSDARRDRKGRGGGAGGDRQVRRGKPGADDAALWEHVYVNPIGSHQVRGSSI